MIKWNNLLNYILFDLIHSSMPKQYVYCEECFKNKNMFPRKIIPVLDASDRVCKIKKTDFKLMKNNIKGDYERTIDCIKCGRRQHEVCVRYLKGMWPNGFICKNCSTMPVDFDEINAQRLQHTQCSKHIEDRINDFIKKTGIETGQINVRVISSCKKAVEIKSASKVLPYCSKAIFAFQKMDDGCDVCFFGMYVQEYGSECSPPNTRRVYIAYLDSVHFFQPKTQRTAIYHQLLLGYMDHVKRLGYAMVHIWASPPRLGEDYIFNCHPYEQKMPSPKRLQMWYHAMVEKGKKDGIVFNYNNIVDQVNEEKLTSADQLPYFAGDHLPNMIADWEDEKREKRIQFPL